MAVRDRDSRNVKHPFEDKPPMHERYIVGDDNWGLAETALPVNHRDVASHKNDIVADSAGNTNFMHGVYDDRRSAYIHESRTDGKKE